LLKHYRKSSIDTLGTHQMESESMNFSTELLNNNDANSATEVASSSGVSDENNNAPVDSIYYFGYGPIVNRLVRVRRGFGHIPPENIQPAILYDYRLKFVEGGTANIIPSTGWDVKGILIRFDDPVEFHHLHEFDINYDLKDVSVSVIDRAHLDPRHKNDQTAPFENQQTRQDYNRDVSFGNSCPDFGFRYEVEEEEGGGDDDDDSSVEDDYNHSTPFSCSERDRLKRGQTMRGIMGEIDRDPNAIRAVTFMIPQNSNRFAPTTSVGCRKDEIGMPQERYLKLMTDGLRENDIDETYINDEILQVPYIAKERDAVPTTASDEEDHQPDGSGRKYRQFPLSQGMKKVPKISREKYEKKSSCNGTKNRDDLYFVCGKKVLKLRQENDELGNSNACTRWIKELCHGRDDISFLVYQTFFDPDCDLPEITDELEITSEYERWAEHTLLLYLERGGLSAVHVYNLEEKDVDSNDNTNPKKRGSILGGRCSVHGNSMPTLSVNNFLSSMKGVASGHRSASEAFDVVSNSIHRNTGTGRSSFPVSSGSRRRHNTYPSPLTNRPHQRAVSEGTAFDPTSSRTSSRISTSSSVSSSTTATATATSTTTTSQRSSASSIVKKKLLHGLKSLKRSHHS